MQAWWGSTPTVLPGAARAVRHYQACVTEHCPQCKVLTTSNLLPLASCFLHLVMGLAPLLTSVWLSLHYKAILTWHRTLEISLLFTGSNKAPYYCKASDWITQEMADASSLALIWGETDVTGLDLYAYRGQKEKRLQSLSGFLIQGISGWTSIEFIPWYFYSSTYEQPLTQKWKNISTCKLVLNSGEWDDQMNEWSQRYRLILFVQAKCLNI